MEIDMKEGQIYRIEGTDTFILNVFGLTFPAKIPGVAEDAYPILIRERENS